MSEINSIINFKNYGKIRIKLSEVMKEKGVTRNKLRTLTGVKYDVIDRYYKGVGIQMADLDFLAKVCCVFECQIGDLLEYHPPE